MKFFTADWCQLSWTSWIAFSHPSSFTQLPSAAGLYRIRAVGIGELFYIGQTGRNLRERLGDLRRNTMQTQMPFNDPHTAAPSLWAWRDAEHLEFECSAAPITFADDKEEDRKHREGVEFYLLWHYRLEFGASTRCNYGRFHASYLKSSDRKKGIRGYRLSDDMPPNPAGGPSLPPLHLDGHPFDNNWMGLEWTAPHTLERVHIRSVTTGPGVYKLFDQNKQELLYIGESYNVQNRLSNHERKLWGAQHPLFSYVQLPFGTPAYQRHEIENDLIAGFYDQTKTIPTFQLVNHNLRRSASDT